MVSKSVIDQSTIKFNALAEAPAIYMQWAKGVYYILQSMICVIHVYLLLLYSRYTYILYHKMYCKIFNKYQIHYHGNNYKNMFPIKLHTKQMF